MNNVSKKTLKNTKIEYMYRDANNYKESQEVVFEGLLSKKEIRAIFSKCVDDVNFIPEQVGLEPLQARLQKFDSKDWGDDHPWHELLSIEQSSDEPTEEVSAKDFYRNFIKVKKWNDDVKVGHILDKKK